MPVIDQVRLDVRRLRTAISRAGVLRGELSRLAKIGPPSVRAAIQGKPVNLKAARSIARVVRCELAELLIDESPMAAAEAVA